MIEITKSKLLDDGFNSIEGRYWYYLYYFRIYNEDKSKYVRYAFVVNFDGEDFAEFNYDDEREICYNYKPKDYADELAYSFIDSYYNSTYENHDELFEDCKATIEKYNRRVAPDYDSSTIWGMACELTRMTFGDVGSRQFVTV